MEKSHLYNDSGFLLGFGGNPKTCLNSTFIINWHFERKNTDSELGLSKTLLTNVNVCECV